jgi:hypothetical protein
MALNFAVKWGVSMEARVHKSQISRDWKEVYKAALFEDDNAKIPQRIADAETALAARAVELFDADGDQVGEQQAMENARYFLRVLGSAEGMLNISCEHGSQTKHSSSLHINGGQALFVSEGGQDLHTTLSTARICNE